MIKTEEIRVWGFEHAIRGMRNPLNSWHLSDSITDAGYGRDSVILGNADLNLMKRLYKAGSEHRKYLRQIIVSMDIVAPLYWWKEFDTYKVGTVANSCSTMHTIANHPITVDCFSMDAVTEISGEYPYKGIAECIANLCEGYRLEYLRTGDKRIWRALIQVLPESWNQCRTVTMNYENVITMIKQRSGHKLVEWREFVNILKDLPYIKEIVGEGEINPKHGQK